MALRETDSDLTEDNNMTKHIMFFSKKTMLPGNITWKYWQPALRKDKKNYMCVSDHMGLQNRVGRSGFFLQYFVTIPTVRFYYKNKKIVHFRTDFKQILSSKPHNFSQSGPIYFFFLYDPQ